MLPGLKYTKFFVFVFVGRDIYRSRRAGMDLRVGLTTTSAHFSGPPIEAGASSPELTQLETHPLASTDSRRDKSATEAPPCATGS